MKRVTCLLTILFSFAVIFGQSDVKEDFYDAEFFFAEEDYSEALYAFNKVYKSGYEDNANINYRIGVCLLNIKGRRTEAIPYLEKAVQNMTDKYKEGSFKEVMAPRDAILYLGNAYRINNELDKAVEQYNTYKEFLTEKDTYQLIYTDKQIESCANAKEAMERPVRYTLGNLGQMIQTAENKFNPVVSADLSTVAFMGEHKFYNGVYVARKINGKWAKPLNITPSIQSDGNQNVLSLSKDGNKILLAWFDQFDGDIYMTEWANNRWNKSVPLDRPVNSRYYESHACFSPDEQSIYFTSNRNESLGGMDIFRCDRHEDGSWGEAINLGETINTPLNEESPFISPEGDKLYFSSQGHNTIGGFDVFYCELNPDGTWGQPVNMGYPLNTTDDDFAFSPLMSEDNELFLFAKGEDGQKDLFKFDIIPAGAQPVIVDFDVPLEPEEQVAEEVTEEKVEEKVEEEVDKVVEEVIEETKPVVVEKPKEVEKYSIKPVFFDFDSYALKEMARKKLDDLAEMLVKYPELKLEIKGYTDALGSFDYNMKLSLKRANAVADYLISKGVDKQSLKVTGMSENDPVAINRTSDDRDSPEGRQLNRRVQFSVSVSEEPSITIEKVQVPDHLKIKN